MGAFFGCGTVALLHRFLVLDLGLRRTAGALGIAALVLHPPFVIWCSGGLETSAHTFFMFLAVRALLQERCASEGRFGLTAGLASVALIWVRPEGFLWVAGIALAVFLGTRLRPVSERPTRLRWSLTLGLSLAGLLILMLWRHSLYDTRGFYCCNWHGTLARPRCLGTGPTPGLDRCAAPDRRLPTWNHARKRAPDFELPLL